MKNILTPLAVLLVFFLFSCKDEPVSVYDGCCGNPPLNERFGLADIYVANLFTPNGDGLNDRFFIAGDSLKRIISLEIKNRDGMIVYEESNLLYEPFYAGWDGTVEGSVVKGFYTYSMRLESIDGTVKTFEGGVCNYPCDIQSTEEKISPANCTFPAQQTSGEYDPTIASGELNECFQ